jgi:small subunit ribosomal protein S5
METSEKAMAIVGNGCGGIGFGMAKHTNSERATELAIAAAQRDMIHVSLYKGQLYHDLVGRKNNIKVILYSRGPGHENPAGDQMVTTVMEFLGVKHYSAKIIGPKRRNPFTVAQAIFDAFSNHVPFEAKAADRGLRLMHVGADRFRPRQVFPYTTKGPSFSAASSYAHRTNQ